MSGEELDHRAADRLLSPRERERENLKETHLAIYNFSGLFYVKVFRGAPLAIYDFRIYFMQKPLGGHPLRSVILGFAFL